MKALPSIRRRVTNTLIVVSLAWGIAVTAVVWLLVRNQVDDLLDSALQESAEVLFGLMTIDAEAIPMRDGDSLPAPKHDERLVWQVVGPQQQVLLRSHRAPSTALRSGWQTGISDAGREWRVYGIEFKPGQRILYVAQHASDRRTVQIEAATVVGLGTLLVGILFAAWLRIRIKSELDPLQRLSQDVGHYDPLKPGSTLSPVLRAELESIHRAITELGERLARRVANERAFAAHAAHALRTPLAGMDAQLAVALRECTPATKPRLQRTREAANRLTRVVTALLTLFRSGVDLQWQSTDLAALIGHIPAGSLDIRIEDSCAVEADPDLLAAALINLLDNAARHGGTRVTIGARSDGESQIILVEDDGPGIPEARRLRIQAALDAQDYEGEMGLGLMLADLVARAHGGSIRIVARNEGFAVELILRRPAT